MQVTLYNKRLDLIFLFTLLLTLITPSLFPYVKLSFFSPFLIITCYKKRLLSSLWIAVACGLILDLLSSQTRLGVYGLTFCFTLILLYPQKQNFFADSLTTLPIMTFLFASLSSLMMAIVFYSIDMKNVFSWHWVMTDLIAMPAADAAFAFSCFILPALLFGKRRRQGKDYFLSE